MTCPGQLCGQRFCNLIARIFFPQIVGRLHEASRNLQLATLLIDLQRAGNTVFGKATEVVEVIAWVGGRPLGCEAFGCNRVAVGAECASFCHSEDSLGERVERSIWLGFFFFLEDFKGNGVGNTLGEDEVVGFGDSRSDVVVVFWVAATVHAELDVVTLGDEDVDSVTRAVFLLLAGGWDREASDGDEFLDDSFALLVIPALVETVLDSAVPNVGGVGHGDQVFQRGGNHEGDLCAESFVCVRNAVHYVGLCFALFWFCQHLLERFCVWGKVVR